MKNILVPTDFSPEADQAKVYAQQIAIKTGATVHFLHVMESFSVMGSGLFPADPSQDAEADLFQLKLMEIRRNEIKKRALSSLFIEVETKMHIQVGEVFPAIKNYITDNAIDLVIMGSKGTSGLEELLIGSNAERLVSHVPAPVMVVKNEIESFAPKRIVFPTDCSPGADESIALANLFSETFGSEIHVLHVTTPSNFYSTRTGMQMLEKFVADTGLKATAVHMINDLSEEDGIFSFAEDNDVDMIVMSSRGRKGLSRFISGSVATDVVNHSAIPVLVGRNKQD